MPEKIDTGYLRGLNPPVAAAATVAQVLNQLIDEFNELKNEVEKIKSGQLLKSVKREQYPSDN